jgi:hypothetical protein
MHHAATVLSWVVAVLGTAVLASGLARLRSGGRSSLAAFGRVWMGLFALLEAVPRLAGWSSGVVLVLSVLALAPLLLAVRALYQR